MTMMIMLTSLFSFYCLSQTKVEEGNATYYSKHCTSKTASGERVHLEKMTCAHKTLPFGTLLRVTNKKNGKSVVVKVNDRGPFVKGRIVDLSWGAAKEIDMLKSGVVPVIIEIITEKDIK
ncbi:MAG: septal ring lytic transglycosylase RlpA family protein [Lachnospiraceae bacterium]|nr:septal ring lytic transglycosylase RlpA family protein [Lachnospiraceae bacterium]